jgi:hypothetical protein
MWTVDEREPAVPDPILEIDEEHLLALLATLEGETGLNPKGSLDLADGEATPLPAFMVALALALLRWQLSRGVVRRSKVARGRRNRIGREQGGDWPERRERRR